MDITSRLKTYMEYINVPVTKFADTCLIPRPSMTQLLKGRNKKISDEVISKIHTAYPDLSIMWLLFGEGEMLNFSNNEISEAQNGLPKDLFDTQPNDYQSDSSLFTDLIPETKNNQSRNETPNITDSHNQNAANATLPFRHTIPSSTSHQEEGNPAAKRVPDKAEQRRVVNIMVFYSDMSFESFIPQRKQ